MWLAVCCLVGPSSTRPMLGCTSASSPSLGLSSSERWCSPHVSTVHWQHSCSYHSQSWRRSRIGTSEPGGARMTRHRRDGWGLFGGSHSPSSSSRVIAATSPTFCGFVTDLEANDTSIPSLPPLPDKRVLVGVGTVVLDFLASVASFPDPDSKIRSLESLSQGGGNVGNALTAAARLGLSPRIFSKLANDAAGIGILKELESNGVDVSHIVVAAEGVSPFTYVIVDQETKTRTCIHSPGYPPLELKEFGPLAIASFLNGAHLLYLDGRIPDAALPIAEEARKRQLPIILDAERKRERLDELLTVVDYLVTSAKFPQMWTEAPTLAESLISLAAQFPHLKFIIVTQGSAGCVMLERSSTESIDILDPNSTLLSLQKEAEQHQNSNPVVLSSKVGLLRGASKKSSSEAVVGRLLVGTAAFIPSAEVVDTTGAGDAFIGGITYGILSSFPPEKMLPLGAIVVSIALQKAWSG